MNSRPERLVAFFQLLRPKHWIKNLACFIPAFCSGIPLERDELVGSTLSFLAFSMGASFVYVINDQADPSCNIAATLAIATYAVFTVVSRPDHSLLITCPPVVYGKFRYLLLVETQEEGEAPELVLTF